jgi:hypothetical protein
MVNHAAANTVAIVRIVIVSSFCVPGKMAQKWKRYQAISNIALPIFRCQTGRQRMPRCRTGIRNDARRNECCENSTRCGRGSRDQLNNPLTINFSDHKIRARYGNVSMRLETEMTRRKDGFENSPCASAEE